MAPVGEDSHRVSHPAQHYSDIWTDTWNEFNRALRSPEPFNSFFWLRRLASAAIRHAYIKTGLVKLGLHRIWRPLVPMFAVLLISSIIFSYFAVLRYTIKKRWCCAIHTNTVVEPERTTTMTNENLQCEDDCWWIMVHDATVAYLGFMILFNFLSGCFLSPGVALPVEGRSPSSTIAGGQEAQEPQKWRAIDGQGGCFGWNVNLNVSVEQRRVTEYNEIAQRAIARCSGAIDETFPSPNPSVCSKCNITRPARCHHCTVCNRCILQFDHHCVFLNNCVGYNNYRPFFLTLLFLTLGCWYGAFVLFPPFYEHFHQQIAQKGFAAIFSYKTGVMDISSPWILIQQLSNGANREIVVIKIIYPILFAIGVIQAVFLSSHVRYVLTARTALEHMIVLDWHYNELIHNMKPDYKPPPNPFDHGWYNNAVQILGLNLLMVFLPIHVEPLSLPAMKHD
jgi:hypothetical protein